MLQALAANAWRRRAIARRLRVVAQVMERHAGACVWCFVGLGVALRLIRYLLRYPLWGDECMLAVAFLDAEFGDVIGALPHYQVAPLLYLWTELAIVKCLGFNELTLRLISLLCGVGSVFLFRHVSGRVLGGWAWIVAMGIFAVSYYPIRHSAEVKPYACDLLVSLAMLALAVEWWRRPDQVRWFWLLALLAPLALGFSYPAVFVGGGISLAVAVPVFRRRQAALWAGFLAFNAVLSGAFLAHYHWHISAQSAAAQLGKIDEMWATAFPPITRAVDFLVWLVNEHTGRMFAYPFGGERGASVLTFVAFTVALFAAWRRGQQLFLALCLAPLALTFVAALWHKYPYGGSARTMQFFAPAICVLAGLGVATLVSVARRRAHRGILVASTALGLVLFGAGSAVRDLTRPYKTRFDRNSTAFARWFWTDAAQQGEVVCIHEDLGWDLYGGQWRRLSAVYRCNQRIYSKPHRYAPRQPNWERIGEGHPLRCVLYGVEGNAPDPAAVARWRASMEADFQLVGRQRHVVNPGVINYGEWYEVYEFVPKSSAAIGDFARRWNFQTRRGR